MGIAAAFRAISDENIEAVLKTPPLIGYYIFEDEPEFFFEKDKGKKTFFGFGKKKPSAPRPTLTLSEGENNEGDLDKSWHGLHYCLTGTDGEASLPLGFIVSGGQNAGDIDNGYGPARLFTSAETNAIQKALSQISVEQLKKNYLPEKMQNTYLADVWTRDGDEGFEYIADNFNYLKKFLVTCVSDKLGMVFYIC